MRKLYTKETFKNKVEWLNHRGMGGSSVSALFGMNPYQSIMDLYRAIKFPKEKSVDEKNESMRYGTICEPIIRKQFALDFEKQYKVHNPKNFEMYRRKDKPYMTASLDGILTDKETGEKLILEIKTHDIRNSKDELENWSNSIPQNYFIQVIHYLAVMNDFVGAILVGKLRFFDYNGKLLRTETRYYYIDRNDKSIQDSIANVEKRETEFWTNNIEKNIPPLLKISL